MQFSDSRFSEVPQFPFPLPRLLLTTAAVLVAALIAVVLGFGYAANGRILAAAASFTFALFALGLPAFGWNNERSLTVGPDVRRSINASTVHYESKSLPLLVFVIVSGVAMGLTFGINLGGPFGWVVAAFSVYLSTSLIPILVTRTVRRGYVELDGKGIRHRAWAYEAEVAWTDVVDITFAKRAHPAIWVLVTPAAPITRKYTTRFWRIERIPVPHVIELDCRRFGVHPVALAQWLTFYTFTPTARAELGTEAAADRLAAIEI